MLLTVLDIVIKTSLLLAIAAGAAGLLRRSSASARHFVWSLGLTAALAAPMLSFAVPRWELPLITIPSAEASPAPRSGAVRMAPPITRRDEPSRDASAGPISPANTTPADARAAAIPSPLRPLPGTPVIVFAVWGLGALLVAGRVALGLVAVWWMSRRTAAVMDAPWLPLARTLAADLGLRRVRFLRTTTASMPMAWGIFHPSVLMPADADAWPDDRLRIVLLHELAHVKRRDCLTHLFAQLACAAHWFNPLAWMAARQLRAERERACDDLVLASGTRGPDYADQLLQIARVMRGGRFPAVLAGASLAMAHQSQLEGRLMAILDPTVPRRELGRVRATLALTTFAVLVLPIAAVQPWAQEPSQATAASPTTVQPPAPTPNTPTTTLTTGTTHATEQEAILASSYGASVASGISRTVTRGVADGVTGGVATGIAGGVVDGVVGAVVGGVVGGVADGVSQAALGALDSGITGAVASQDPKERLQQDKAAADANTSKGRDPRAVAALIEALKDSDRGVRETAMAALAHVRDPRVFEPLSAALTDASPDVREQAAFGLGQLRDRRAVTPLTGALANDESASVREQAAFALGQIRSADAVDALTAALRDKNADVREQAVFALGQIRDQRAVNPLVAALKDADADVREQAAFALGQLRSRTAVDALIVALKDTSADVREQVAFALGQLRDPRAVDALTGALKDASASVRQQAAFALGQIR